ncbi:MAG: S-layer homology domain-containing protein [Bacillota bacterium]
MNINKVKVYIISLVLFILFNIQLASAHGLVYETRPIDENKIRISLRWSDGSEKRGISITHYYLVNGKTLHIGYEVKDGFPHTAQMDFDLRGAVPPIRIRMTDINNKEFLPFNDINSIEAQDYIIHLHDAGIVNGMPDGTFRPYSQITRAEFMVLMVKALKLYGKAENTAGFTDIEGHWAKDIILLASKHGLISGYADKTIKPDRPITLAEVSSVVSRAFNFKTSRNGIYSKVSQGKWYSISVKKMFDVGILTVKDSIYSDFNEESYINRANCAMMISRALSTY